MFLKIFKNTPDKTLAHLSIVTHGSARSIAVGRESSLEIDTGEFKEFASELKRVMMKKGDVLMVACHVGKIIPKPDGIGEGNDTYSLVETDYDNFANRLSKEAGVTVYATPGTQTRGEIMVGRARARPETCSELPEDGYKPLNHTYGSSKQMMYRFVPA